MACVTMSIACGMKRFSIVRRRFLEWATATCEPKLDLARKSTAKWNCSLTGQNWSQVEVGSMGVNHSSGVRWKLQPLVPHSWAELEQLYLRFQQEAHRRRADPAFQYFLPFAVFQAVVAPLCADKDKLQMLVMFEALDVRRVGRLAAVDFFSGLALLVDAKKPQKLECEAEQRSRSIGGREV